MAKTVSFHFTTLRSFHYVSFGFVSFDLLFFCFVSHRVEFLLREFFVAAQESIYVRMYYICLIWAESKFKFIAKYALSRLACSMPRSPGWSTGHGCFSALEPDTGRLASIAFAFATFLTTSPTFKIRFGFGFWKMATTTATATAKRKKQKTSSVWFSFWHRLCLVSRVLCASKFLFHTNCYR